MRKGAKDGAYHHRAVLAKKRQIPVRIDATDDDEASLDELGEESLSSSSSHLPPLITEQDMKARRIARAPVRAHGKKNPLVSYRAPPATGPTFSPIEYQNSANEMALPLLLFDTDISANLNAAKVETESPIPISSRD